MPQKSTFHELLRLLRPHWVVLVGATLLGIIAGISVTALLATINTSLHDESTPALQLLLVFGSLCLVTIAGTILSDIGTNYVGQHVIAGLREDLGRKILMAPIDQLERYKTHRLIPVLTHDVDEISDFAFCFAPLAVAFTITLGCLGYLAYLSWSMFLVAAAAVAVGSAIQFYARNRGIQGFYEARELEDEMQKNYKALADGAKELRINRARRRAVFAQRLQGTAGRICGIHSSFPPLLRAIRPLRSPTWRSSSRISELPSQNFCFIARERALSRGVVGRGGGRSSLAGFGSQTNAGVAGFAGTIMD